VNPPSETFEVISKLKIFKIKYFVDWGGGLIWVQLDNISLQALKEIKKVIDNASGYITVIKIEENLKASIDVFTTDPIKYKITEKIKKSFDPKRILNPGKMYSGI
jgi:glycolate oxidase FAD binding subunit